MSCIFQLCSTLAVMLWIHTTESTPLFQGISVQRGFEVKLQPFQFKPLSFFKEKWSPFGSFGVKKGIQKRDLSPAPVFEHVNENIPIIDDKKEKVDVSATAHLGPDKPLSSNLITAPLMETFDPPKGLYTSINRNPLNNIPEKPIQPVIEEVYGELPPRPVGPIPERFASMPSQPFNPVSIKPVSPLPRQPVSPLPRQPVSPVIIQPVNQVPIRPVSPIPVQSVNPIPVRPFGFVPGQLQPSVPQGVVPILTPPPVATNVLSEIPPTDGPLVRGSKLALYFGNVFLQLVSQFITNARLQISQLKSTSAAPSITNNN